jgi:hypothetical protein
MATTDNIFFELWNPTGLINQVMSLEIAVGLSAVTKKQLIVHHMSNDSGSLYNFKKVPIYTPSRWNNDQRKMFTNQEQFPHLAELLEWNENLILIDEKIDYFPQQKKEVKNTCLEYYHSNKTEISDDEIAFADGRKRINLSKTVHLKGTLGWYGRFFYNRSSKLDAALASVKFKKEYYDFAKMVSKSIGKFQGMHLRLSDNIKFIDTTQEMFESWLDKFEQNNIPILVSTCEPGHKMILENKHRFILLDEYIVNNFAKEFHDLKYQDEVVFGLICNLIMHDSINFVGTSASTYSAYIYRNRNQKGIESWDFFDNPLKANGHPYSWNNHHLGQGEKMWWREWPESKLKLTNA